MCGCRCQILEIWVCVICVRVFFFTLYVTGFHRSAPLPAQTLNMRLVSGCCCCQHTLQLLGYHGGRYIVGSFLEFIAFNLPLISRLPVCTLYNPSMNRGWRSRVRQTHDAFEMMTWVNCNWWLVYFSMILKDCAVHHNLDLIFIAPTIIPHSNNTAYWQILRIRECGDLAEEWSSKQEQVVSNWNDPLTVLAS